MSVRKQQWSVELIMKTEACQSLWLLTDGLKHVFCLDIIFMMEKINTTTKHQKTEKRTIA